MLYLINGMSYVKIEGMQDRFNKWVMLDHDDVAMEGYRTIGKDENNM